LYHKFGAKIAMKEIKRLLDNIEEFFDKLLIKEMVEKI